MDANRKTRADSLYRDIQVAHIKGIIEQHHSSSLTQMLESYHGKFQSFINSPQTERIPERVQHFMKAEASIIIDILAECYDPGKSKMLAGLEANPSLLGLMPLITDI